MRSFGLPELLVVSIAAIVVFAADQDDATKNTEKKPATAGKNKAVSKAKDTDKAKVADFWVEELSKGGLPDNVPSWPDVFGALGRKYYGGGNVPCGVFDAARRKYFRDFVAPEMMRQGYDLGATEDQFMKKTDLPTTWTLTGRKRQGCVAD
jgi:hypothetical protein